MKSAGTSCDRIICCFLPWLCCIGSTAAAESYDSGRRMVRFPPVVDRTSQPRPKADGQPLSDDEVVPNDQQHREEAVRLPSPTTGARRIPPPPRRDAPRGLHRPPAAGTTFFAPPPSVRPVPLRIRPEPRFATHRRIPPSDGRGPVSPTAVANEPDSANEREPIGQRPPENTNEWLARDTSLLLKPGQIQTEIGSLYTRQEAATIVVLPTGAPVLERIRSRAFIVPFSIRYGWSENLELFSVVPFGVSHFERDNVLVESTEEAGALGDISAGLVYQIPENRFKLPDSAVSLSVTTPTSSSSVTTISGDQATLGNGVWKVGVGFNFVESYDPIVLFGGLGYQYQFADEQQGLRIERGDLFNFYCGLGLAVSDDVSLSTQVSGFLQDKTSVNDIVIPNSDIEPLSVRLGFVRRLTSKSRLQPYVEFGLTRDAPDAMLGLRYIHDE